MTDAKPALDLLHLDDAVDALVQAIRKRYTGQVNIGTGKLSETSQIAEWIIDWTQSVSTTTSTSIDADVACVAMNYTKANKELGWSPTIEAKEGLYELVMGKTRS